LAVAAELALSEYYNLVLAEQDIYPHHACWAVVELVFYPYDENGVGQDAYPHTVLAVVAVLDAYPHDEVAAVHGDHGHHDILLDLLHQLSLPH